MALYLLNLFNFLIADVRDGLGPFLGVFLQQNGWQVDWIGLVMTIAGLAGILVTTPISMLIDIIPYKKTISVLAILGILYSCSLIYFHPIFPMTVFAQILTAIAGATLASTTIAITLGLVGIDQFDKQIGRNESFNHAGNAFFALITGIASYGFGLKSVFFLIGCSAIIAIFISSFIPSTQINHELARGLNVSETQPQHFLHLLKNTKLWVIALTTGLFHLANAAMLPLLSQSMVAQHAIHKAGPYVAMTIIIAQGTMIPVALFAAKLNQKKKYKGIFTIALLALPLRGILASIFPDPLILFPVEILDGISAGIIGVAIPGLVSHILQGTGRFNTGLGLVFTLQGIGASSSHFLAGAIAEHYGYNQAFLGLSLIAIGNVIFWFITAEF